jgi:hypothetical protein
MFDGRNIITRTIIIIRKNIITIIIIIIFYIKSFFEQEKMRGILKNSLLSTRCANVDY